MDVLLIIVGIAVVLFLFQTSMVMRTRRRRGKPVPNLSGDYGRAVGSGAPVLFYFYTSRCRACKPMTPVIKKLQQEQDHIFAVNAAEDVGTARQFGVMATPTTILVSDGIVREILLGAQPEKRLRALFEQ